MTAAIIFGIPFLRVFIISSWLCSVIALVNFIAKESIKIMGTKTLIILMNNIIILIVSIVVGSSHILNIFIYFTNCNFIKIKAKSKLLASFILHYKLMKYELT